MRQQQEERFISPQMHSAARSNDNSPSETTSANSRAETARTRETKSPSTIDEASKLKAIAAPKEGIMDVPPELHDGPLQQKAAAASEEKEAATMEIDGIKEFIERRTAMDKKHKDQLKSIRNKIK